MLNMIAGWLSLGSYVAFGWAPWRQALSWLSKRIGDWIVALLLIPYLLAVELRPVPGDVLRLGLYLAVPTLLLRFRRRRAKPSDVLQILAVLAIWVPIELDLFTLLADMAVPSLGLSARVEALRLLPEVRATLFTGFSIPLMSTTSVLLALMLFLVRHPVPGIGMTIGLAMKDVRHALLGLAGFAVVGIPVGLYLGFLRYQPGFGGARDVIIGILGGYLFAALPEELLFRGLIQNLITRRAGRAAIGLVLASIVFGLSHLNNTTARFAEPNWVYALMAALAGIVYGWVWLRSRKVTASAITHTLVNAIWGTFFA